MTILRIHNPDYGGTEVFDDRDPDTPIYFHDGNVVQAVIETVLAQRQEAKLIELKLAKLAVAQTKVNEKLSGLFEEAREYIVANPGVTEDQLKNAFVSQFKAWASAWVGE